MDLAYFCQSCPTVCWYFTMTENFSKFCPGDQVFNPTLLVFKLNVDVVKTNILTKFHEDPLYNEATVVYTRFF